MKWQNQFKNIRRLTPKCWFTKQMKIANTTLYIHICVTIGYKLVRIELLKLTKTKQSRFIKRNFILARFCHSPSEKQKKSQNKNDWFLLSESFESLGIYGINCFPLEKSDYYVILMKFRLRNSNLSTKHWHYHFVF